MGVSPTTTCISPTTTSSAGTHAFRVEGLSGLGQNFVFTEESIRSGAGGGSYGSGEIDAQTGKRVA